MLPNINPFDALERRRLTGIIEAIDAYVELTETCNTEDLIYANMINLQIDAKEKFNQLLIGE